VAADAVGAAVAEEEVAFTPDLVRSGALSGGIFFAGAAGGAGFDAAGAAAFFGGEGAATDFAVNFGAGFLGCGSGGCGGGLRRRRLLRHRLRHRRLRRLWLWCRRFRCRRFRLCRFRRRGRGQHRLYLADGVVNDLGRYGRQLLNLDVGKGRGGQSRKTTSAERQGASEETKAVKSKLANQTNSRQSFRTSNKRTVPHSSSSSYSGHRTTRHEHVNATQRHLQTLFVLLFSC